ncbi:MAG: Co2+/Mg2+ efflux protein ApaG [Gemmatimonadaceae bacterium]
MTTPRPFYYRETNGIRITVRPMFLPTHSAPSEHRYVFAYFVRIENVGEQAAQLLSRHWYIHDSIGEDSEVEGEGVVGEQPRILPAGVHEYSSWCRLKSSAGHMDGTYSFVRDDGSQFDAVIPRFILQANVGSDLVS